MQLLRSPRGVALVFAAIVVGFLAVVVAAYWWSSTQPARQAAQRFDSLNLEKILRNAVSDATSMKRVLWCESGSYAPYVRVTFRRAGGTAKLNTDLREWLEPRGWRTSPSGPRHALEHRFDDWDASVAYGTVGAKDLTPAAGQEIIFNVDADPNTDCQQLRHNLGAPY